MLKELLNREFFTSRMTYFFKRSYGINTVGEDENGVLWVGKCSDDVYFMGAPLLRCFSDSFLNLSYETKLHPKEIIKENVTDDFIQKFNVVGSCAWGDHNYKKKTQNTKQCIRCGKTLVRKTEVVKRKVWVEEDENITGTPEKKN